MKKTIGILAHVDSGKTTFAEQLLYHTNTIRSRGRVDHKNSFLDNHQIEKERGITVFSEQGIFEFSNSKYFLIDTPGHIDFSSEMERAIQIMDYGILIINGAEGIQGHTETVWNLLRKNNIPVFIFVNKIDREGVDLDFVLEEIKDNLCNDLVYIKFEDFQNKNITNETIELIAERNENLLDLYMDEKYSYSKWLNNTIEMIAKGEIIPVFSGSALQDIGIIEFLKKFDLLTKTDYKENGDFSGVVQKIKYDSDGTRLTFIKGLNGAIKVKDEIKYEFNGEVIYEKINQIRSYNGSKYKGIEEGIAGEIFAVVGLSKTIAGIGVGEDNRKPRYDMVPTLKSKVIFDNSINIKDVLKNFRILEAEDPSLNIIWNEDLKEIQVNIMGVIQLEVLKEVVKDRFNLNIEFGPCEILYKETINNSGDGYGHFEPLGHYSEVHLKLEPLERNSGILFENKCHADYLTIGNQNLIKTHIFEREHNGILTGSPITDIKITLMTGRAHNKHTSGGDFREATFRALRQGLESLDNIVLEPFYKFKMQADLECMGKLISDIQRLNGSFEVSETTETKVTIIGRGPVATFMDYSNEFISITKGRGRISFVFDGYDLCHNQEEVIEKKEYKKNADINYTSTSIFCSKGQSYLVEWDKAKEHMHCLKK